MVVSVRSEECVCEVTLDDCGGRTVTVSVPVSVPSTVCPVELAHRLLHHHNIPVYLHQGKFYLCLFFSRYGTGKLTQLVS